MSQKNKRKGLTLNQRNTLIGLSFILPNFTGFCCFILCPVIFSFALSFMDWDGFTEMTFVGVANFEAIFADRVFKAALKQTAFYSIFTVFTSMVIALSLALLLNRKLKFVNFFRSVVFFPYVASIVAVGAVWSALFMNYGPVNTVLRAIGMIDPPGWFASTDWALTGVVIVSVWKNAGYFMVIYLAALQTIPYPLYEAAEIEGASKWMQFRRITFPMLTPSHFFVFMMLTINSFKVYDLIMVLTDGGPGYSTTVLAKYIYDQTFISWEYGRASAAAMILFVIIASITIIQFRVEKKFNDFM